MKERLKERKREVLAVLARTSPNLDGWRDLPLSEVERQHIERTLNEYLPNCLATYQALPAGSADRPAGPEGETAGELVERQLHLLGKSFDNLLRLVVSQESVVDEDAGEAVADRAVDKHRGDR